MVDGRVGDTDTHITLKEESWDCETTQRNLGVKKDTTGSDFKHPLINMMENTLEEV